MGWWRENTLVSQDWHQGEILTHGGNETSDEAAHLEISCTENIDKVDSVSISMSVLYILLNNLEYNYVHTYSSPDIGSPCPTDLGIDTTELRLFVCAKLCLTLWDSMDYSLPDFSVHRIFQARILELCCHFLVQGIFLTQGRSGIKLMSLASPALAGRFLTTVPPRKTELCLPPLKL